MGRLGWFQITGVGQSGTPKYDSSKLYMEKYFSDEIKNLLDLTGNLNRPRMPTEVTSSHVGTE
ncbi:hypothetical protein SK128_014876, partial [Halocaridina rubra]